MALAHSSFEPKQWRIKLGVTPILLAILATDALWIPSWFRTFRKCSNICGLRMLSIDFLPMNDLIVNKKYKVKNKVHEKGYKGKPLTEVQISSNKEKSKTRVRVEHVFGFMEQSMNKLYVRSIGLKRASGFVTMVNLTYNLFRYEQVVRLDGIGMSNWQ